MPVVVESVTFTAPWEPKGRGDQLYTPANKTLLPLIGLQRRIETGFPEGW